MIDSQKSEVVLAGPSGEALVRKTPDVCGGDACIRDTRIMVWLLVSLKKQGMTPEEFLCHYPSLTAEDLTAAWEYYRRHPQEIDEAIKGNDDNED